MTPPVGKFYDPHPRRMRDIQEHFAGRPRPSQSLLLAIDRFAQRQTLSSATEMLRQYFRQKNVEAAQLAAMGRPALDGLRNITAAFADKRAVLSIVDDVLGNESAMVRIAARSYPHPIGFDKFVLFQSDSGFKLRLHIYWRRLLDVSRELVHLHRFEMASSPITGELTNRLFIPVAYRPLRQGSDPIELSPALEGKEHTLFAYTGYERNPSGQLVKRHMGRARLVERWPMTFVPGQTYAQRVSHAHLVETNAEQGQGNRDTASTVYIHGPTLPDRFGRTIPVLFEPRIVPDAVVARIPSVSVEALDRSLREYRDMLAASLEFYDWLYHPRHGHNLSVGMLAGYLLSADFGDPATLLMWQQHQNAARDALDEHSVMLAELVRGDRPQSSLDVDDPRTRYLTQLINKAWEYPQGAEGAPGDSLARRLAWLDTYGDLAGEFERYVDALRSEQPEALTLKPAIWDGEAFAYRSARSADIQAMLTAVDDVRATIVERANRQDIVSWRTSEGVDSDVDRRAAQRLREMLASADPITPFVEERDYGDQASESLAEGAQRYLADPIDGTTNYLRGDPNYAISLAKQRWLRGQWLTEHAVVARPMRDEIFWATRGLGAFRQYESGGGSRLQGHHPRRRRPVIDLSIRGFGPEHAPLLIESLMRLDTTQRATGCAAGSICDVVEGTYDATIVTAAPYDVAAALLIAKEAGATIASRSFEREIEGRARCFCAYLVVGDGSLGDALLQIIDKALGASPSRAASRDGTLASSR